MSLLAMPWLRAHPGRCHGSALPSYALFLAVAAALPEQMSS